MEYYCVTCNFLSTFVSSIFIVPLDSVYEYGEKMNVPPGVTQEFLTFVRLYPYFRTHVFRDIVLTQGSVNQVKKYIE